MIIHSLFGSKNANYGLLKLKYKLSNVSGNSKKGVVGIQFAGNQNQFKKWIEHTLN